MNKFLDAVGLALSSIWANKLRSFMMVLGNVVAVTSIIAVVSLWLWRKKGRGDLALHLMVTVVGSLTNANTTNTRTLFLRGAEAVSKHTRMYASLHPHVIPAFVNGAAGALVVPHGKPFAVMGFTISHGGITEIDVLLDPERLTRLGLIIPP